MQTGPWGEHSKGFHSKNRKCICVEQPATRMWSADKGLRKEMERRFRKKTVTNQIKVEHGKKKH